MAKSMNKSTTVFYIVPEEAEENVYYQTWEDDDGTEHLRSTVPDYQSLVADIAVQKGYNAVLCRYIECYPNEVPKYLEPDELLIVFDHAVNIKTTTSKVINFDTSISDTVRK